MNQALYKEIEHIFRSSENFNDLFDAFNSGITAGIQDISLYKILLANPFLSEDELRLFGEKLASELQESRYDLFIWLGEVFESKVPDLAFQGEALGYFQKAAAERPYEEEPYLRALTLYSPEYNLPVNRQIIKFVLQGTKKAKKKSLLFFSLGVFYRKLDNAAAANKYFSMSEKEARREEASGHQP